MEKVSWLGFSSDGGARVSWLCIVRAMATNRCGGLVSSGYFREETNLATSLFDLVS